MEQENSSKHPRQDFQVERLTFFSDAVFAIAITLLVIEFKVPHITEATTYVAALEALGELKLHLIVVILSFFFIAIYWRTHHFLFKYIHDYNQSLLIANMAALLPVIFLPFTTAFLAEAAHSKEALMLGLQVFFINQFFAGIAVFGVYWVGAIRHKHLSYEIPVKLKLKFYEQILFASIMFAVLFIVSLFTFDLKVVTYTMVICLMLRAASLRMLRKRYAVN